MHPRAVCRPAAVPAAGAVPLGARQPVRARQFRQFWVDGHELLTATPSGEYPSRP